MLGWGCPSYGGVDGEPLVSIQQRSQMPRSLDGGYQSGCPQRVQVTRSPPPACGSTLCTAPAQRPPGGGSRRRGTDRFTGLRGFGGFLRPFALGLLRLLGLLGCRFVSGPRWSAVIAIVGCTQTNTGVPALPVALTFAGSGYTQMWDDCTQVTTEGLNRSRLVSVVVTPGPPISEQVGDRNLVPNADLATVPHESGNRRYEILQRQDGVGR